MGSSTVVLNQPLMEEKDVLVFDSNILEKQQNLRNEFIWPDASIRAQDEFIEPIIDLGSVLRGDPIAISEAVNLIHSASANHGFFQVINHGVDSNLIKSAYHEIDSFFKLPVQKKMNVVMSRGGVSGYSGAHADRFSSKLPWKETISFEYHENDDKSVVLDFFKSALGEDFERTGMVFQRYCEEMTKVGLVIMELLAIGLGVEKSHYRKFYEDEVAMMRCNYYPPCKNANLTFGTGPHCDPTSLTILHQDQVGGFELFANNMWQSVKPRPDALVINIGDTLMALTNGIYKSCLHRAIVNSEKERTSLVFFMCPKGDKVVKSPKELGSRKYPDFTWSEFWDFTQYTYRADVDTLDKFANWIQSSKTLKL